VWVRIISVVTARAGLSHMTELKRALCRLRDLRREAE
jgi:hypothetical protein